MSLCQLTLQKRPLWPFVSGVKWGRDGVLLVVGAAVQGDVGRDAASREAGQDTRCLLTGRVKSGTYSQPQRHAEAHQDPRECALQQKDIVAFRAWRCFILSHYLRVLALLENLRLIWYGSFFKKKVTELLTSRFVAGTKIPSMNTPSNGPLTTPMTVNEPCREKTKESYKINK